MNRFEFYSAKREYEEKQNSLKHYGTKGQKWGERHWQNYDGTFNEAGKERYFGKSVKRNPNGTVFISGSSKTQFTDSPYYRQELPKSIQDQIQKYMNQGKTILVGDAPGIDRQVQDYLNQNGYNNVEVYSPGKEVRYNANPKWKTNLVDVPDAEEGSGEWLSGKDKAMADRADEGLAIILDNGAAATRNNVSRLEEQGKNCDVFQINEDGEDKWVKLGIFDKNILDDFKHEGYDRNYGENEYTNDYEYLENVSNYMQEDFNYDYSDHKLQNPIETFKKKSGNCHDQTLFEKELFEQMGYETKPLFFMEVNPKNGNGGDTHSFICIKDGDKIIWFENAWKNNSGIHVFNSENDLKKWIKQEHKDRRFGNYNNYPEIVFGEFKGEPGDSLQEIVDKSLK